MDKPSFVAQPIGDGCYAHIGLAQNTRVRSLDAIPFTRSLRFDMELFDWSNIHLNYAPITFWYMLPGGEIQPKPFVSDVRERLPTNRQIFRFRDESGCGGRSHAASSGAYGFR